MSAGLIMASIVHCYVGCNGGAPDGQALHVLACDTETGAAKLVQTVKGVEGTTYFQFDREGRYLYSAIAERKGGKSAGCIVRFKMDGWRIGAMERLAELPCEAPCHVSLTPDGRRVAFAAYTSATAGTVGIDGKGLSTFVFPDDAMGPNAKRQQKAYAHQTFFFPPRTANAAPRSASLGVVDLGCDRIWFFDPVTMTRDESLTIGADPGDGPRHAVWSRSGKYLFVVNELSSTVASYAFREARESGASESPVAAASAADPRASFFSSVSQPLAFQRARPRAARAKSASPGRFDRISKLTMLPADFRRWEPDGQTLATKAAAIKLTADGRILMASNRGHDSIAFYDVVESTGELMLHNIAGLKGRFPRDFALMPGERFMIVGHKMSNEIQMYRFDRTSCTLQPVGEPISAWRPLCFAFKR